MFNLTNRVAVITGAASGIGAATARCFAAAGADVALAWYPEDEHDIDVVRRDVEAHGRRCVVEAVDVGVRADVDRLVERTVSELGGVHIAVANAGIARRVPLSAHDDEAWNRVMNVNLHGAYRLFRACLPHMQRQGFGRLLATSSVAGTVAAWPQHLDYVSSKAGLVGLIQTLAVEYGPEGITANVIAPGVIRTPQALDPVNSLGPDAIEQVADRVPVRRVGRPEDIAHTFQFLASDEASYVSGQLIVVDGARHLAGL